MRLAAIFSSSRLQLVMLNLYLCFASSSLLADAKTWPIVEKADRQPVQASIDRLVTALDTIGESLKPELKEQIDALKEETDDRVVLARIQSILDPLCLVAIQINPESRVHVVAGDASKTLMEKGWRSFLVKVVNQGGVTAALRVQSPQAAPMMIVSSSKAEPEIRISPAEAQRRWLELASMTQEPMLPNLTGVELEYRIIQCYSRDAGKREATLMFDVGQGTQDLGFRNELPIVFDCLPSIEVQLSIKDWNGSPTTCSMLIRDQLGRIYPHQSRREPPDFFFHAQIYRTDGETVRLPPGNFTITAQRGPEYLPVVHSLTIEPSQKDAQLTIQLQRWVHMQREGWISGDHHVHAAGCAHFENPTQGVTPEDMMRHIIGEDLNVGCVLSWGPCWYHQKQFFDGKTSKLSLTENLMRYDVEVSGFPSSHAGHLCLLNLTEDDYPNTNRIEQWPSWTLPVLKWGKEQGGVVGYSHSGWGLALPDYLPNGQRGVLPNTWGSASSASQSKAANKLPDYAMPPFDGIGANEYIVAVTHDACDFISAVDTPAVWELNIWYHTLNCGYQTRISGETDFPCIYGERVGLGRVYVQMPKKLSLTYEPWVVGLRDGRSYASDGLSHLSEFRIDGFAMGERVGSGKPSVMQLERPSNVSVTTRVSAMLTEQVSEEAKRIRVRRLDEKPYWHLERSRIDGSRRVPVELIVNGEAVARQEIIADGKWNDLKWDIELKQSSWVAIRVFPSMHSNPIFVEVDGRPIRASVKSAKWCRQAVDVCWAKKSPLIRESEREEASQAYDFARMAYDKILAESSQ